MTVYFECGVLLECSFFIFAFERFYFERERRVCFSFERNIDDELVHTAM